MSSTTGKKKGNLVACALKTITVKSFRNCGGLTVTKAETNRKRKIMKSGTLTKHLLLLYWCFANIGCVGNVYQFKVSRLNEITTKHPHWKT